jgi:hypothetical protein
VAVGLEDADFAIPASGEPFDARGITDLGTWPSNQCQTFLPTSDGNYTEHNAPTVTPSSSPIPSASPVPTYASACEPFSLIGSVGTAIFQFDHCDEALVNVVLSFPFKWRGQEVEYTSITVSPNGVIFLGDAADCPDWCQYDKVSCCDAFPIGELSGSRITRIALAQHNLRGNAYYYTSIREAFVISFEGVDFYLAENGLNLYFQAALYADGRIGIRWGPAGSPRYYHESVAAGLEDFDLVVPGATGEPFDTHGATALGGTWPTDQCRMCVPTADGITHNHCNRVLPG